MSNSANNMITTISGGDNLQSSSKGEYEYCLADDLMKQYPESFIGARTTRDYIRKHNLGQEYYIFARRRKGEWVESDGGSNRVDKVFLRQDYVDEHIAPKADSGQSSGNESNNYILSGPKHTAPICLSANEKFRDEEGNVYDVDVRGQRHYKQCYFRVKDISNIFNMHKLSDNLRNKSSNYKQVRDYVMLILCDNGSSKRSEKQVRPKKHTYLTYTGLMKVIYSSRNKNADHFIDWASKIVYTAHLGTKPQRQKVAAKIGKVDHKSFKAVTNTMSRSLPGIYLIYIGPISDLRAKYGIGPEYSGGLYKFGYSEDITRRMGDHTKRYGPNMGQDMGYPNVVRNIVQHYFIYWAHFIFK